MLICKKANTERKTEINIKERETEKESERKKSKIPWRRAGGSTERRTSSTGAEAERSVFFDLRSVMKRDQTNNDNELAVATTAATWPSVGKWFTGFDFGLCIRDFLFFFFDKHLCALCLVCWVLCLVCFCIGVWSLCQCQRRRDVMAAPVTWWVDWVQFLTLYFFFFFGWEWACRERATCNGLAVGLACHGWAWFCFYIYIYIYFQILVQIFFGFFFFFWLESRTDNFFFFF